MCIMKIGLWEKRELIKDFQTANFKIFSTPEKSCFLGRNTKKIAKVRGPV